MKVFLVINYNLLGDTTTFNFYANIYNFVIWFQNNRLCLMTRKILYDEEKIIHFFVYIIQRDFTIFHLLF